jgi:hypothetical protein
VSSREDSSFPLPKLGQTFLFTDSYILGRRRHQTLEGARWDQKHIDWGYVYREDSIRVVEINLAEGIAYIMGEFADKYDHHGERIFLRICTGTGLDELGEGEWGPAMNCLSYRGRASCCDNPQLGQITVLWEEITVCRSSLGGCGAEIK